MKKLLYLAIVLMSLSGYAQTQNINTDINYNKKVSYKNLFEGTKNDSVLVVNSQGQAFYVKQSSLGGSTGGQNLQQTINNGGYAGSTSGNSYISIFEGGEGFLETSGDAEGNYTAITAQPNTIYITNSKPTVAEGLGQFEITDGVPIISHSLAGNKTVLGFETPAAGSTGALIKIPAPAIGEYVLAKSVNAVPSDNSGNINLGLDEVLSYNPVAIDRVFTIRNSANSRSSTIASSGLFTYNFDNNKATALNDGVITAMDSETPLNKNIIDFTRPAALTGETTYKLPPKNTSEETFAMVSDFAGLQQNLQSVMALGNLYFDTEADPSFPTALGIAPSGKDIIFSAKGNGIVTNGGTFQVNLTSDDGSSKLRIEAFRNQEGLVNFKFPEKPAGNYDLATQDQLNLQNVIGEGSFYGALNESAALAVFPVGSTMAPAGGIFLRLNDPDNEVFSRSIDLRNNTLNISSSDVEGNWAIGGATSGVFLMTGSDNADAGWNTSISPNGRYTYGIQNGDKVNTFIIEPNESLSPGQTSEIRLPSPPQGGWTLALKEQIKSNHIYTGTTILPTDAGTVYATFKGTAPSTFQLPDVAGNTLIRFVIINAGTASLTLEGEMWDSGSLESDRVLPIGASMELYNNGEVYIIF